VERGTHASLLAADGDYARMWALQKETGDGDRAPASPSADAESSAAALPRAG
jgi:hypothetical protein